MVVHIRPFLFFSNTKNKNEGRGGENTVYAAHEKRNHDTLSKKTFVCFFFFFFHRQPAVGRQQCDEEGARGAACVGQHFD